MSEYSMLNTVKNKKNLLGSYLLFLFFFCSIFIRNLQPFIPLIYFYVVYLFFTISIGKKIVLDYVYLAFIAAAIVSAGLLLKSALFNSQLSNMSFSIVLFFSLIPFVVFSSFRSYRKFFLSGFFNRFIIVFCLFGLVAFIFLILSIEHNEARYLWEKLGEESGKRGLINHLVSFGFYEDFLIRYSGFILDPNRWCFCLLLFYMIVNFNKNLPWSRLARVIIGTSILLTFSRAGIGLWVVYLFFSNLVDKNYVRTITIPIIILSGVLFFLYYFNLYSIVFERLTYGIADSSNTRSRGYIWSVYFDSITTDWRTLLVGQGVDMDPSKEFQITPHNAFLYLGFQFGIMGSMLYSTFFIYSIRAILNSTECKLFIFNIGLFLLLCMTMTDDYFGLPFFWLLVCFLFSQNYLKNQIQAQRKNKCLIS